METFLPRSSFRCGHLWKDRRSDLCMHVTGRVWGWFVWFVIAPDGLNSNKKSAPLARALLFSLLHLRLSSIYRIFSFVCSLSLPPLFFFCTTCPLRSRDLLISFLFVICITLWHSHYDLLSFFSSPPPLPPSKGTTFTRSNPHALFPHVS